MRQSSENESPAAVGVIGKVFSILEAIQSSPSGLTLTPICDITGINKSTAHRFLKYLAHKGYLIRTQPGAYLIGPKLSRMSARANQIDALQAVARPVLWELWKSTGETVNLATLDQDTVLYVEVLESPHEFRFSSRVGARRSLHATALGKALTAFLPDDRKERILSGLKFELLTPNSIMNLVEFRQELEVVRRQGYAVDDEEVVLGARCLAAPILIPDGTPVAAVSISGPVTRISFDAVSALSKALVSAAQTISASIGFSAADSNPAESLPRLKTSSAML